MKLASTSDSLAAAAAILLAVVGISSHDHSLQVTAFAPTTHSQGSISYKARVKGQENSILYSTVAQVDQEVTKTSSSKKSSNKKRQGKPMKKGKKQRKVGVNRLKSKGKNSKGKNSSDSNKSFRPMKDLKLGSKVSGKVVDVCDFGVFVNIGYATRGSRVGSALLHISQIQDKKITDIRDKIKVGDSIEGARVISVDAKKGEVGLSLRTRRPKRKDFTKFKVGDQLDGKIASVVPYGVFVDVGADINALLHISRITGGAIENVRHHLNEGDPVSVHVLDVDSKKKNLAVSMLDKRADQYLDRRMSQRLKKLYGTAGTPIKAEVEGEENTKSTELGYFDEAIKELEEALKGRE